MTENRLYLFDTTLRDGQQTPGIDFSVEDKIAIAGLLEFAAFVTLRQALGERSATMKPINVTVDYMRAGQPRDTYASAHIERLGGRIANVEAQAWQKGREEPIASAQMNFLLVRD